MRKLLFPLTGLLGCVAIMALSLATNASAGSASLKVGMPQNFFPDMSAGLIETVTEPFVTIMHDTAGLSGKLVVGGDPFTVAQQLSGKQVQLGVFHGFEFAWIQKKHPELHPLMVAGNAKQPLRAFVLVAKDSPANTFADLKGKDLAVPKRTRQHCRYFVEPS